MSGVGREGGGKSKRRGKGCGDDRSERGGSHPWGGEQEVSYSFSLGIPSSLLLNCPLHIVSVWCCSEGHIEVRSNSQ